jgi:hypothetical protein
MRFLPLLGLLAVGCDLENSSDEGPSEATRASWVMTLKVDGAEVKLPLESLDVFLVEDNQYPEIYELLGPSVALVGEFPTSIHVGYSNKWEQLFGKAIPIKPQGGDPRDEKDSHVTIPGKGMCKVIEGTFTAKKTTGKTVDSLTLWGTVKLLVKPETGDGFSIEGTFAVNAKTWG